MPRKSSKVTVQAAGAIDSDSAVPDSGNMAQSSAAGTPQGGLAPGGAMSSGGSHCLTGNGPSTAVASSAVTSRPMHNGKKEDFPVFDITFKSYLRIIGLQHVLTQDSPNASDNARVFDELMLALDSASIKLVMNVTEDDGKLAYDTLRLKYKGDALQRKTNAINDLANLQRKPGENFQQLESRIDGIKKTLDSYKILNDEGLIVAMYAKCLPQELDNFKAMVFHGSLPTYAEFKVNLHNYLTHTKFNETKPTTSVMSVNSGNQTTFIKKRIPNKKQYKNKPKCKTCLKFGHYSNECPSKVYCKLCKNKNHHTNNCRRGGIQAPSQYSGTDKGFSSGGRAGAASSSSSSNSGVSGASYYPRRRSRSAGPTTAAATTDGGRQCR